MSTVALVDVDRTGYPNLALMKLSAWHKAQGDSVRLLRNGELPRPGERVYASVVFSWNRVAAEAYEALGATVGGTGLGRARIGERLPDHIERLRPDYTLYGIDYGWGYLMRGCIWDCAFCVVPQKEGKPSVVASIDDLLNPTSTRRRPFVVLLDNELFFKERWAIAQLEEFTRRGIDFSPSQGLDVRVLTPALADALAAAPFWNVKRSKRQVTFAFDSVRTERQYRRGMELLLQRMKAWHLQSFVLVGYDSTLAEDLHRIGVIQEYGVDPFVMVYRDPDTGQASVDPKLRALARWVNRRLCKVCDFAEYSSTYRSEQSAPLSILRPTYVLGACA